VRHEVHRERQIGARGVRSPDLVETHLGLDRARLSALTYALDGPSWAGERLNGVVKIFEVCYRNGRECRRTLIDHLDERVAARVLNEIRLPRADQMRIEIDQLQDELDSLIVENA
jgi:hypothetical protein